MGIIMRLAGTTAAILATLTALSSTAFAAPLSIGPRNTPSSPDGFDQVYNDGWVVDAPWTISGGTFGLVSLEFWDSLSREKHDVNLGCDVAYGQVDANSVARGPDGAFYLAAFGPRQPLPAGPNSICGETWRAQAASPSEPGPWLLRSVDHGVSWKVVSVVPAAYADAGGCDVWGDAELTGTTTGVAYGLANYNPTAGWSSLSNCSSLVATPGIKAPRRYHLVNSRLLSDGSVLTLWQGSNTFPYSANLPFIATRTAHGHLISRIKIDPRLGGLRPRGGRLPQLAPGECPVPARNTSHGIVAAAADASGRTIFAVTNPNGPWSCHSKYIQGPITSIEQVVIVSFDGGRTFHRVAAAPKKLDDFGDGGGGSFIVSVTGRSLTYAFDTGCQSSTDMYVERYESGRWHAVGCRPLLAPSGLQ